MKLTVLKSNVPINEVAVDTPDIMEKYEIYVGRAEDCHVRIDDPLISRHHFVLKNDQGNWTCEKLSQLGLVTVNGSVAQHAAIRAGDEIKCGAYSLLVSDLPRKEEPKPVQPIFMPEPHREPEPVEESPTVIMTEEPVAASAPAEPAPEVSEEFKEEPSSFGENELAPSESDFSSEGGEITHFEGTDAPVEDDGGDRTSFFKAFVNYQLVLFGEHAPYDRYQIDQDEIFIGRDKEKCQIVLDDNEVSSVHAVVKRNSVDITLQDLNSSNGTILNGERINKATLATGDEFVIGSTSFTLEVRSDLLEAESDRLMPVESGQFIEKEEIEEEEISADDTEVDFNAEAAPQKGLAGVWKDPAKRKKIIYAVAGVVLAYVLLSPDEPEPVPTPTAPTAETKPAEKPADKEKPKLQLSKELEKRRNIAYELGVSYFDQEKYDEALKEFQTVMDIDPDYKKVQTYFEQTSIGLKRLAELETQKRVEEERIKTKKMIEELLSKAREAVKERQVPVAENYFAQIAEKDPENIEVQQLKLELEAWQKEEERKALEKAAKEAARKAMVDALQPGKTFYLKREWYRAILKLEEYLRRKGTDEDLVKEASEMLSDAKTQLASDLGPLIGKARSLKEGQDLKSAYEAYLDVLKIEPTNAESLNEVDDIRSQLETRSKRVYREAIIAESLSLFNDAKEKFQEVQQISPTDSEYYKKASDKLKNYLE